MAKDWLVKRAVRKGARCPCCNKFVKVDKRPLNSSQARALIWMVRMSKPGEWIDMTERAPKFILRTKQHSTMRQFGLLERMPNTTPARKHSGIWRVTQFGRDFVSQRVTVAKFVFIYNDKVLGRSDEQATRSSTMPSR
jgi:hypothetical protein